MTEKGKNTPTVRFKGFTDDWEQRKLGDLVDVCSGKDYKHLEPGDIPVFGTGGYMLSVNEALSYDKDAIGIGRKGTIDKPYILKAPFWTVDTLFYAIPRDSECLNFSNYIFQNINWRKKDESTGVPSLSKNAINNTLVEIPNRQEQLRIGKYLGTLDHLSTLHQRHLDEQKALKKYFLQNMFPAKGEKVPRIRFQGFTGDWEERKLGEIYKTIGNAFVGTATPYYVDSGHFYLESNNVKDGQINRNTEVFINDEFYNNQRDKWLHTDDMVMVQSGHVGHSAVIPKELNNTAAHALIMFKELKVQVNPYFLNYQYQTYKAKKQINNIAVGNTIKHILASSMQEFIVDIPSYTEQQKIAHYFCEIDRRISLYERQLTQLQAIKKFMLQNLFV